MAAVQLAQETYLPGEGAEMAKVYDFFAAHEAAHGAAADGVHREPLAPQYFLSGPGAGDQVALPAEVYEILRKVVGAMRAGLAVSIAPQSQKLTTQQAADLLGISRPTLVKLLESGRISFERVGSHRRLYLRDVLAFREERRREQYAALAATAVDLDDEDDLESTLETLRDTRKAVAQRRRARV